MNVTFFIHNYEETNNKQKGQKKNGKEREKNNIMQNLVRD